MTRFLRRLDPQGAFLCGSVVFAVTSLSQAQIPLAITPAGVIQDSTDEYRPFLNVDGETAPEVRGVWDMRGYGNVMEITPTEVRIHQVTSIGSCLGNAGDGAEFLYRIQSPTTLDVTFHPLIVPYTLERLQELPDVCAQPVDGTPIGTYEFFAATVGEHYAFLEERDVNWLDRVAQQRRRIHEGMSDQELCDEMKQVLAGINDGHVSLTARLDGEEAVFGFSKTESETWLEEEFELLSPNFSFSEFARRWHRNIIRNIEKLIVNADLHTAANQLSWGLVNVLSNETSHGKVGYLCIRSMSNFANGDFESELAALHAGLDLALEELHDTQALIVDVSFNSGGMDLFSDEIASHFYDKPRIAYSKAPGGAADLRRQIRILPSDGVQYDRPVYVLCSDYTASAAEIFVMAMRALPQVQVIGTETQGILSDAIGKKLPNGWELSLSIEVYEDHEGECWEALGVPPDVEWLVFDPEIDGTAHATAVIAIADWILQEDL